MMNFEIILLFCGAVVVMGRGLREEFTWTRLNYDWNTVRQSRQIRKGNFYKASPDMIAFPDSIDNGASDQPTPPPNVPYIYENNIPMGANVWNNKLFITVPRRRPGIPSTLNYIWANGTNHRNVPLIPYPNWEINTIDNSSDNNEKFVSIYRVAIDDKCKRLWFVDTGLIETPGNHQQIHPTTLVVIDLLNDRIIRRHVFDSSLLRPTTTLASVTLDISNCDDGFAYLPDLGGYGLIVYSWKEDKSWRVTHNYFYLEPLAGEMSIGGHQFQWNDGIFSIVLTSPKSDGYKDAYFHSMAGYNIYKVSTKILTNESLATRSYHRDDFKVVGSRNEGYQASSSAMYTPGGVLFLGLINQNALGCWNIDTPLKDLSIVQKDDKRMIYPSDVKVRGDDVIVMTNNMPIFAYGTLNYDEINFRVWVENVNVAILGTSCAPRKSTSGGY